MDSILLQILSSADVDWLLKTGHLQILTPDSTLSLAELTPRQTSLLVNGQLSISLPGEESEQPLELSPWLPGSPLSNLPGLASFEATATVRSQDPVQLFTLDTALLQDKLIDDDAFAAHYYQFLATFLLHRLKALMIQFKLPPAILYELNLKEATILFADLQDSHLDWLSAVAQPQCFTSGRVLQFAGYPIDAVYIVLEGALSLSLPPEPVPDLVQVLGVRERSHPRWPELTRLGRGDVFGDMRLLQSEAAVIPLQMVQVEAVRDTEILMIPRWRIQTKLLHDSSFARQFYQVMTRLVASKYQTLLTRLGFRLSSNSQGMSSDRILNQMDRAETKFEWMVQRVQTKMTARRTA